MQLTKADKWLIVLLVVFAAAGIILGLKSFSSATKQEARVYKEGNLIKVFKLRPGYSEEFRVGGEAHYNIIKAENGRIRVTEADCPDQVCVRTGWVSIGNQQIVCLPYRVIIKIVSAAPSDIDDISR